MSPTFRHSLLTAAVLSALVPVAAFGHGADKGRWINDGFGRAAKDGQGSTCVSSGGPDYAFDRPDCDSAAEARRSGASAKADEDDDEDDDDDASGAAAKAPAAKEDAAAGASKAAAPGADAGGAGASPGDAGGGDAGTAAAAGAAAAGGAAAGEAAAGAGAAAAGAVAGGAAAMASDTDDDEPTPRFDEPDDDDAGAAMASGQDDADATAAAGAASLSAGGDASTEASANSSANDPDYAPGSVVLEDRSPGVAPPAAAAAREATPVIDNRVPEFPITKYTTDAAPPAAAAGAAAAAADTGGAKRAPEKRILRRSLEVEKGGLFDTNSAVLKSNFIPDLNDVVAQLKAAKTYGTVTVTGHTDRRGSAVLNQRLSERRARAVRDYLVAKGLDPARITAVGKGKSMPVTQESDCAGKKAKALQDCMAPDRRVDIEATGTLEDVVVDK